MGQVGSLSHETREGIYLRSSYRFFTASGRNTCHFGGLLTRV